MSQVYAKREDNGKRVLVAIECDGCDAMVKPHPEISESGWSITGVHHGAGDPRNHEHNYWCPECTTNRGM